MYKALVANPENLVGLLSDLISKSPHELDGFQWAAMPQEWYCERLSVSIRTLRRWVSNSPFVRQCKQVDGHKMMFLRVGEPGPETARHVANKMSCFWRAKFDRQNSKAEYGCLFGLAETWPAGEQIKIFKMVIAEWGEFMSYVDCRIMEMQDNGEAAEKRYYKFPSIKVIRRFHDVAVEQFEMHNQEKVTCF